MNEHEQLILRKEIWKWFSLRENVELANEETFLSIVRFCDPLRFRKELWVASHDGNQRVQWAVIQLWAIFPTRFRWELNRMFRQGTTYIRRTVLSVWIMHSSQFRKELGCAVGDPDPEIRWAAISYLFSK